LALFQGGFFVAGIGALGNNALNSLLNNQFNLLKTTTQLSSGLQINSAADNPSGLAIFNALSAQAAAFDQGSLNAQDALNATNVAQGATQTVSNILGNLNVEAVAASNSLLSPQDEQSIQAQANQQIQQINTVAQNTNFNGINLLQGNFAGTTPATPASGQVTSNDLVLSTGNSVINTAAGVNVPAATPGESIQVTVSAGQAQVNVVDNATGNVTNVGSFASGAVVNAGGVTFTLGNFGASDTGTATIQVTPGTAFAAGNSLTVQTGANQGATSQLNFASVTSSSLGVSNLNFGTVANAEDSIGIVSNAIDTLSTAQSQLGAQTNALQNQINANNIASTALTASASQISDLNFPSAISQFNKENSLSQIGLSVLRNANNQAGFLTGLLSATA
jgi:flagellin